MKIFARLCFTLTLCLPLVAQAETYRVDLIVFVDKNTAGEEGRKPAPPNLQRALELSDAAGLRDAGITVLDDDRFALNDAWSRLRSSKRYQPVIRIAWLQNNPPNDKGPALHLTWGAADDGISPVDGTVSLLAGHYLHLDAHLLYTQSGLSYRLNEKRLMRRDELHHLDSPKLGILARVTKAGRG